MGGLIKICVGALLAATMALQPAHSAAVTLKRGLNMDIWDTWPSEDRWGERAVLLPYPEWQRKLDRSDLIKLKKTGFDFIRIPIDPAPFLSSRTEAFRKALYASVLEAVDTAQAAGLNVVVDLHTIPAGNRSSGSDIIGEDDALFERYLDVVHQVAQSLSGEDASRVALELMNEPLAGCDGGAEKWNRLQSRLHETARAAAPETTLILSGGCWAGAESLAKIDPADFADDNLIWTFHSYAPFLLTHQGAGWAGDFIQYVTGLPYPPYGTNALARDMALERIRTRIRNEAPIMRRAGMLSYLDELLGEVDTPDKLEAAMGEAFDIAAEWAARHGVDHGDILLGEFGMIRQEYETTDVMNPKWRAAYVADMTRLAEAHGFSWSIWGYGGAFGVVEAFEGEPAEPDVLDVVRGLDR